MRNQDKGYMRTVFSFIYRRDFKLQKSIKREKWSGVNKQEK